eukprot:6135799-Pyramimonas_sp.AAC.1
MSLGRQPQKPLAGAVNNRATYSVFVPRLDSCWTPQIPHHAPNLVPRLHWNHSSKSPVRITSAVCANSALAA